MGRGSRPGTGGTWARRVRLDNVPFLHAKHTYSDVIIVAPAEDGRLTWNASGVAYEEISTRIAEDGGRYALIVDYAPHAGADGNAVFAALCRAAEQRDIVAEGAFAASERGPGRAHLAVPEGLLPPEVMAHLHAAVTTGTLTLIHPVDDELSCG